MQFLSFSSKFLIFPKKKYNLNITKRFYSLTNYKGNKNFYFNFFNKSNIKKITFPFYIKTFCTHKNINIKMASTVPQVVSLDPINIPIDYHTPIHDIEIQLKDLNENFNVEESLVVFLVNSSGKDNASVKINSKTKDNNISEFLKQESVERFNAKLGTSKMFCILNDKREYVNMAFIGCGSVNELSEADIRRIVASLVPILQEYKISKVSLIFEIKLQESLFRFFLENLFYEYMTDERFKSTDKTLCTDYIKYLTLHIANAKSYNEEVEKSRIYYSGTYYASQLIAAPSNYCNPVSLANAAVELAEKLNLQHKILGIKEIEELKMGAYLSVGKGSMYPNRFIHLTYKGNGEIKKKVALVGKGITFDSGGYNIKASPGSMIDLMKYDMSGCAAVLGCAYCIGTIKPENVEVHFISAVCENMVSKNSYRPGDIITASNGKTIEVGNTDAEGRLTLADALVYAEKLGVDYIIDIATLTGAMLYSLGTSYAGVFGTNEELINKLLNSSKTSNEPLWWLPIINEYRSSLNSKYADLNNISQSVKASSIVASLFLKEFVQSTPWAHIDIAGVSWNFKCRKPKGFGVRLLSEFILNEAI
ncbi:M17 leucyl aminopeptidase, putative [Plasmodium gallinaceum]|uniref:Leucine aminopeptidase n=1 Tax=Plasmodium gallinaceum TaxID=5849 RepID=A0A1J1GUD6_PLAGA|nr:M17 leucyl aminopeptidase, putative [Plasmodium gallinaceum]CRG94657.1 M17 leucyl aminopeptidase, putative [Plasmodium gallinaceum]